MIGGDVCVHDGYIPPIPSNSGFQPHCHSRPSNPPFTFLGSDLDAIILIIIGAAAKKPIIQDILKFIRINGKWEDKIYVLTDATDDLNKMRNGEGQSQPHFIFILYSDDVLCYSIRMLMFIFSSKKMWNST